MCFQLFICQFNIGYLSECKRKNSKRAFPFGKALGGREGGKKSDVAEHVVVRAHRVVVHEQLATEGFVVEVSRETALSRARAYLVMARSISGLIMLNATSAVRSSDAGGSPVR